MLKRPINEISQGENNHNSKRLKKNHDTLPTSILFSTDYDMLKNSIIYENKELYTRQQVLTIINKILHFNNRDCSYIS